MSNQELALRLTQIYASQRANLTELDIFKVYKSFLNRL